MSLNSLSCPSCGSPDLHVVTSNRRRCEHCGTESVLSSDRTRLVLVQWECPQCGFNNESGAAYCGECGSSLAQTCPVCGNQIRIDLRFCSICGANFEVASAEQLRRDRGEELRRLREPELVSQISLLQKRRESALRWTSCGVVLLAAPAGCVAWFLSAVVLSAVVNAVLPQVPYDFRIWMPIVSGMALGAGVGLIVARSVYSRDRGMINRNAERQRQALEELDPTVLDPTTPQECED